MGELAGDVLAVRIAWQVTETIMRWLLPVFLQSPLPPFLKNLIAKSHIWSNNSTLGTYSKGINAYIHIDYTSVHTGSIHKAKFWKEKKRPVIVNR